MNTRNKMSFATAGGFLALQVLLLTGGVAIASAQSDGKRILIHVKTALSLDDAQICAAPNVALAALTKGDKVTMLFDASAVTSVTRGYGLLHKRSSTNALDRAKLPARERQSLSEQMGLPLDQVPHNYGEYLDFLRSKGVEIYGNKTMMLLYNIDPVKVAAAITPVPLQKMVELFDSADRVIVY